MKTEDSNTSEDQIALRKYCIEVALKTDVKGSEVLIAANAIYKWIISSEFK